ncbi:Transcription regulator IclR, C-terminal [Moorella glycerini]|uniref:Glycerol operon regulatory protein n=1 Tax=Neomoorella stamsii TaxID=1266720 RepID=A0A9X7P6L3_9FIRM|nr:Transcriptional regulator KdgR [Moorella stamsii]CEP66196.1 Transcription regulator IclR, C-terminal [Moorella glycerini]
MPEGIQSVQRALYILERLASCKNGATASEIAKELGVNRSTVFRLMETLIHEGYVRQAAITKRYYLTMKVFSLGSKLLDEMDIRTSARGILEALQKETGHTIHLGLRDLNEVVYIDKISGTNPIQMYSMIGRRAPLYCTGVGKAILAFLKEEEIESYMHNIVFTKFTPNTITDPEHLKQELNQIRDRGYALDLEEHENGIRCVAAPIFNYNHEVIGSISVAAVAITLGEKNIEDYVSAVMHAARTISELLGARI